MKKALAFSTPICYYISALSDAVYAPVAQLDRVTDYESVGRGFESLLAYQKKRVIRTDDPLFDTFKHFNKFNDAGIWGSREINPANLQRPEGMETLRPLAFMQALRNLKFSKN